MKKLRLFVKRYPQLGLVLLAIVIGLGLDIAGQDRYAHIVLGGSALLAVIPVIWHIYQSLRRGEYGVDILAATAIITSVILGEYWAGMVIVLMLVGGEALEDYAEQRAKVELTALVDRVPKKAHLFKSNKITDIPVNDITVHDKLIIKPGEVVPVDCVIIEGASSFDESSLTGESLPIEKTVGSEVLSGSVNIEGTVTVKVLRTAKDSQYEQIIKLVKGAASSQSPFVRLADRYSIPFTIISFAIAGAAWALSGEVIRFLEVIVVATPCPLILGAPIALISGMSRAAKHGIIVKTGSAMERLAAVKTMAFDKTGTLTMGTPTVAGVRTYNKFTAEETLLYAAALEQNSNHILARAIVDAAASHHKKLPKARGVTEETGHGLSGTTTKRHVMVGRLDYLQQLGVTLPSNLKASQLTSTAALVAVDGVLAGVISFEDPIRTESKSTLAKLKTLGIRHLLMVTGDNQATAQKVASQLGITDTQAECLPADKLLAIEQVTDRPVAFVGDGINDAPVLTASDVGIALGARGSTAASESADVVIMLDDLSKVAQAVTIAKRTFAIARQSILLGIGISVVLMLVFATGKFKPVYGAAIQELVDVTVILNALRAHGTWKK